MSVVEAAMARGAVQKQSEFAELVTLVEDLRPATVVEIGTLTGGTLAAWCLCATDDAVIVSVDLPDGEWGGGYSADKIPELQALAQPGQTLNLIRGDSHQVEVWQEVVALVDERGIDFLFIDGDHTYDGVSRDWLDYLPMVRAGGIVAFHDVLPHPDVPGCEVSRLWAEIRAVHHVKEFCAPDERHPTFGQWGGIGVVVAP